MKKTIVFDNKKLYYIGSIKFETKDVQIYSTGETVKCFFYFENKNGKLKEIDGEKANEIEKLVNPKLDVLFLAVKEITSNFSSIYDEAVGLCDKINVCYLFDTPTDFAYKDFNIFHEKQNITVASDEKQIILFKNQILSYISENFYLLEKLGLDKNVIDLIGKRCSNFDICFKNGNSNYGNFAGECGNSGNFINIYPLGYAKNGISKNIFVHEFFHLMSSNKTSGGISSYARSFNEMITEFLASQVTGEVSTYKKEMEFFKLLFPNVVPKEVINCYFLNNEKGLREALAKHFSVEQREINILMQMLDVCYNLSYFSQTSKRLTEEERQKKVQNSHKCILEQIASLNITKFLKEGNELSWSEIAKFKRLYSINDITFALTAIGVLIPNIDLQEETINLLMEIRTTNSSNKLCQQIFNKLCQQFLDGEIKIDKNLALVIFHALPIEFLIKNFNSFKNFFASNMNPRFSLESFEKSIYFKACTEKLDEKFCKNLFNENRALGKKLVYGFFKAPKEASEKINFQTFKNLYSQMNKLEKINFLLFKCKNFNNLALLEIKNLEGLPNNIVSKYIQKTLCQDAPNMIYTWDEFKTLFKKDSKNEEKFFKETCKLILGNNFKKNEKNLLQTAKEAGFQDAFYDCIILSLGEKEFAPSSSKTPSSNEM